MVREGQVAEVEALSELGVFGTWVTQDGRVLLNEQVCCLGAKHNGCRCRDVCTGVCHHAASDQLQKACMDGISSRQHAECFRPLMHQRRS